MPRLDNLARVGHAEEPVVVETLVTEPAVEALDERILVRPAGVDTVPSYRHSAEEATKSAINLGQLDDAVEAVGVLARRLLAGIKSTALTVTLHGARRRTPQSFEGLYVDLHHLAGNVATATGNGRIADACRDVQRMIDGKEARSPIIAEGHSGAFMAPARSTGPQAG